MPQDLADCLVELIDADLYFNEQNSVIAILKDQIDESQLAKVAGYLDVLSAKGQAWF